MAQAVDGPEDDLDDEGEAPPPALGPDALPASPDDDDSGVDTSIELGDDEAPEEDARVVRLADRWPIKLFDGRFVEGPFDDPDETGAPVVEIWTYTRKRLKNGRVAPARRALQGHVPFDAGPGVVGEHFGSGSWYACVRSQAGQIIGATVFETGKVGGDRITTNERGVRLVAPSTTQAAGPSPESERLANELKTQNIALQKSVLALRQREEDRRVRDEERREEELKLLRAQNRQLMARASAPAAASTTPSPAGDDIDRLVSGLREFKQQHQKREAQLLELGLIDAPAEESGGSFLSELEEFIDEAAASGGQLIGIGAKGKEIIDVLPGLMGGMK